MFLGFFQLHRNFPILLQVIISSYLFFMNLIVLLILQVLILFHFSIPFPHQIHLIRLYHKKEPILSWCIIVWHNYHIILYYIMRYDVILTCNMILLNVWKSPLTNSRDSELVPWTQIRRWRLRDARMRDRGAQHLAKILQDVEPPTPIRLECLCVWMVEVFLSRLQSLQLSRSTIPIALSCCWFVQFDKREFLHQGTWELQF